MVDVESAVQIAKGMLAKVMPEYVQLSPYVEEFELDEGGNFWNVTFRAKNPDLDKTPNVFYPYRDKLVQISVRDGDLHAIRNPSYD